MHGTTNFPCWGCSSAFKTHSNKTQHELHCCATTPLPARRKRPNRQPSRTSGSLTEELPPHTEQLRVKVDSLWIKAEVTVVDPDGPQPTDYDNPAKELPPNKEGPDEEEDRLWNSVEVKTVDPDNPRP